MCWHLTIQIKVVVLNEYEFYLNFCYGYILCDAATMLIRLLTGIFNYGNIYTISFCYPLWIFNIHVITFKFLYLCCYLTVCYDSSLLS